MTGTNLKAKAKTPAETRRLGYARVSSYGQTLDAQVEQLRADGCVEIYYEKVSDVRTDRRELLKLLKALTPGDVVIAPGSTVWPARSSICLPSSNKSWTRAANFGHWPSHGRTPPPAPGG
jgi:hypothetical protein